MQLLLMRIGFSLLFGGAGLYLANAARTAYGLHSRWKSEGILTEGRIVDFEKTTGTMTGSRDYSPFFKPVVVFAMKDGSEARFTSLTANRPNPYTVGQRVSVRYIPADSRFMDLDESASALWPLIALVFASMVCLAIASLPWVLGPPPAQTMLSLSAAWPGLLQ